MTCIHLRVLIPHPRTSEASGLPHPSPSMLDTIDPFRRRSVALALYRMLTSHRFDICVVREALEATGLDHDRQAYAALRLHHCEHYQAMPPGFHAELASQTLALFDRRPVLGDGLFEVLAAAAGLDPSEAPAIQAFAREPAQA